MYLHCFLLCCWEVGVERGVLRLDGRELRWDGCELRLEGAELGCDGRELRLDGRELRFEPCRVLQRQRGINEGLRLLGRG